MKQRIRAAAILKENNKILLVKHVHPVSEHEWWVPPGGGIEKHDNSVIDCIIREIYEETGYKIKVEENPIYIREFYDKENVTLNIELFFNAKVISGDLTITNIQGNGPDEHYIKDVKWLTKEEIKYLDVFPEELKDEFGENINKIYLGRQIG